MVLIVVTTSGYVVITARSMAASRRELRTTRALAAGMFLPSVSSIFLLPGGRTVEVDNLSAVSVRVRVGADGPYFVRFGVGFRAVRRPVSYGTVLSTVARAVVAVVIVVARFPVPAW